MIVRELWRLACAIQFLTRLPAPTAKDWPEDHLVRAAKYFPLVGVLVGAIAAMVFAAGRCVWAEGPMPAILAVAAGIVVTGGLHEDGLADTMDGLGGGCDRDERLSIMKDSRLGTYGALALGVVAALKGAALSPFPSATAASVLVAAHALARSAAVVVMAATPYAAPATTSKWRGGASVVRPTEAIAAVVIGAVPLLQLPPVTAIACLLIGATAAAYVTFAARRLIGGHTGDVLGAVEQAFETGFILAAAALLGLSATAG